MRLGRIERHLDPNELSVANADHSKVLDHGASNKVSTEAEPDTVTDLEAGLLLRGHAHRLPACMRSRDRFDVGEDDRIGFGEHTVVVALGIDSTGQKHALTIREGSMDNASLCRTMLADLVGAAGSEINSERDDLARRSSTCSRHRAALSHSGSGGRTSTRRRRQQHSRDLEHVRIGRSEWHLDPNELLTADVKVATVLDHSPRNEVCTKAEPDAVTDLEAELCVRGHVHRLPANVRSRDRFDVHDDGSLEIQGEVAANAAKGAYFLQRDLGCVRRAPADASLT